MRKPNTVLFVIAAILVAAVSVPAVPAKPIDATTVTLLPANGTSEQLRKAASDFGQKIARINADARGKREQLRSQMVNGFDKAVAKAQASGNLNAVMSLKTAKDNFDELAESDVPFVKNAIAFREKKTAEFEATRLAETMKAAKEFNDELEKAKKDETTKGNFDAAKTIADHQTILLDWVKELKGETPSAISPVFRRALALGPPRNIVINADNPKGCSLGMARKGERFSIQYLGGTWSCNTRKTPMESPDDPYVRLPHSRAAVIGAGDAAWVCCAIPPSTKTTPFVFTVLQDGEYFIRMNDSPQAEAPQLFTDNGGEVLYAVQRYAADPHMQWSTNPTTDWALDLVESRMVTVQANDSNGISLGMAKKGERFAIQYKSGTWTASTKKYGEESPDVPSVKHPEHRLTIVGNDETTWVYVRIPPSTKYQPFVFVVPQDGEYLLRTNDLDFRDNRGSVQYFIQRFSNPKRY